MNVNVTYFGKLTELTGKSSEELTLEDPSVKGVKAALEHKYPSFKQMTYQVAENNTILTKEDTIQTTTLDIFPPFSGG